MKHAVHAITQPTELRFDDVLKEIAMLSGRLTEIALPVSQPSQQDSSSRSIKGLSNVVVLF